MKKQIRHLKLNYHFLLIGISCAEEDYKFCWHLNHAFQFDFERIEDLEIINTDYQQVFSVFEHEDQESEVNYHLIANRNADGILVPEENKADYFLKISGEYEMIDLSDLMNQLKQLPPVIAVYSLTPGRLKSVDNLLF